MIKKPAFKRFLGDLARGQVNDDSRRIFNDRERRPGPVEGDIVIMVDGSGSMAGRPLEIAMKTSELIRQAAEKADYRVFITMWGDDKDWSSLDPARNPYLIAEPGMETLEVQQRMETVLKGLSSGTRLAPGFPNVLGRMGEGRPRPGMLQGRTHFMIISDGGIADPVESKANMQAVLNGLPNCTLDIIQPPGSSEELQDVVDSLELKDNCHKPVVTPLGHRKQITETMIDLFEERASNTTKARGRPAGNHVNQLRTLQDETASSEWGQQRQ